MPITLLDLILLVVMLISGLLAMIRGFMREVLSIAAWLIAAIVTLWAYPRLSPMAHEYFHSKMVSIGLTVGVVFLVTLLVVSIATVKISDMVLDSRVGALDRTLGFVFGLGRGLIIVVVAFIFFSWLVPPHARPTWVQNAKSRVVLEATGNWLRSLLPEHPEKDILEKLKRPGLDEQNPPPSDQHSELRRPIYREDDVRIARVRRGARALIPL